jgi:hypothetical protein
LQHSGCVRAYESALTHRTALSIVGVDTSVKGLSAARERP